MIRLLIAAVLLTSCGSSSLPPLDTASSPVELPVGDRCFKLDDQGNCVHAVSFVDLIANPEKFHDQTVMLTGYVRFEFEGNCICPAADTLNTHDCFWLDVEGMKDPGFRSGPALVEGRFDGTDRGHFGLFSGTIGRITRLQRQAARRLP